MSGLAHYLEDEGIATVAIALVREHVEVIRPPRALWVPFELGRPYGAPNEPDFQRAVVRAALDLLVRDDGPVLLADYSLDAPARVAGDEAGDGWVCPIDLPRPRPVEASDLASTLIAEIGELDPWYALGLERRGRTTFGLSNRPVEDVARFAAAFAEGAPEDREFATQRAEQLKLVYEDLRAWYQEAAAARPGGATSRDLADWFWGETAMGTSLLRIARHLEQGDDEVLARTATQFLIPRSQRHRLEGEV